MSASKHQLICDSNRAQPIQCHVIVYMVRITVWNKAVQAMLLSECGNQSASVPIIIKPTFSNCDHLATGFIVLQQELEGIPVGFWALGAVFNLLASGWMHADCAKQLLCMQAVTMRVGPSLEIIPGSSAGDAMFTSCCW